ncbi:helitron_like_N domain-containing protein [Trichonephila clavipes]|nr:helitron_like_N domain-containing protein [Trichonephila clavipes]
MRSAERKLIFVSFSPGLLEWCDRYVLCVALSSVPATPVSERFSVRSSPGVFSITEGSPCRAGVSNTWLASTNSSASSYFDSERLISSRIPFMQIQRLRHVHAQFGQMINVPVSVNTMVNRLLRNVDDYCVNAHIKRRRTSYLMGLVTKRTIKAWLQYLIADPE